MDGIFLHSEGDSKQSNVLLFENFYEESPITLRSKQIKSPDKGEQYQIIWDNEGTKMSWYCDKDKPLAPLTVDSQKSTLFTFEPCYFIQYFIEGGATSDLYHGTLDELYQPVDEALIKKLYRDSGLANYKSKNGAFGAKDFCYIYKAQVSKESYKNRIRHPYAIGIVWGHHKDTNEEVINIFFVDNINNDLTFKIFDPQDINVTITDATQWSAKGYLMLI